MANVRHYRFEKGQDPEQEALDALERNKNNPVDLDGNESHEPVEALDSLVTSGTEAPDKDSIFAQQIDVIAKGQEEFDSADYLFNDSAGLVDSSQYENTEKEETDLVSNILDKTVEVVAKMSPAEKNAILIKEADLKKKDLGAKKTKKKVKKKAKKKKVSKKCTPKKKKNS